MQQATLRLVISVANQQARRFVSRVQRHAMCRIELFQTVAFCAEMHQVFASFVVLENMVAGIAVRQENIPVSSNGDCGRVEFGQI